MKIAIDAIPLLSPLTGVGNYTYQIARALRAIDPPQEYTYFYGYYSRRLLSPAERREGVYRLKEAVRKIPLLGAAARNFKDLANFFSSRRFDLYFEPNFIPLRIPARRIVATVPDFSFLLYPQWHPPDKVRYFQRYFGERIQRADRIILISHFIREQAVRQFGYAPEKLVAIHLGFDRDLFQKAPPEDLAFLKNRYRLPENFILCVGSIEPRKNLKTLLQAYADLAEPVRREFKLVLVGFKGWENEEIIRQLRKRKNDLFYIGYVPMKDLAGIYHLARLFVYPSFYEGFGLPPLEAMACGCPCIVSDAASLPEVCGEAAYYVNPGEAPGIAKAITRVLEDEGLRQTLIARGFARSEQFSWERSAREHLKVFEEVMES